MSFELLVYRNFFYRVKGVLRAQHGTTSAKLEAIEDFVADVEKKLRERKL